MTVAPGAVSTNGVTKIESPLRSSYIHLTSINVPTDGSATFLHPLELLDQDPAVSLEILDGERCLVGSRPR